MPQGEFIRAFQDHGDWVSSLAISPDNTTLATKSGDGFLRLFDLQTGELIAVTESNNGSQNFISSQLLVSASKKKGPETKNLASLLLLKAAEEENLNYASILQQSLFHFGYRMDGLQLKTENRFTLELLEDQRQASTYIRPEEQTLLEWLVTKNNFNAKHAKAILP